MGTHTILFPDDSAASSTPLDDAFVSAMNRIADKVLCPLGSASRAKIYWIGIRDLRNLERNANASPLRPSSAILQGSGTAVMVKTRSLPMTASGSVAGFPRSRKTSNGVGPEI